ncbi:hypothetical protein FRC00_009649, partial [Tulasnella sp. 408]
MNNLQPNTSALKELLQELNHLFVDITRLAYDREREKIVGGFCHLQVATLDFGAPTAKLVAAKQLRLVGQATELERLKLASRLARELKVWAGLQHPHVLPLLGFYLGEDYQLALLISEYMGHGDLKNYLVKAKPSFNERLCLIRDLTDGLTYLHTQSAPIRHGDLKPALGVGPTGFTTCFDGIAKCTVRYSSPEILILGTAAESLSNDIWSWSCLVSEVLTDVAPFSALRIEAQIMFAIIDGKNPNEAAGTIHPARLRDLLASCWNRKPEERPEVKDCLCIIESTLPMDGSNLAARAGSEENSSSDPPSIAGDEIDNLGPSNLNPGSSNDDNTAPLRSDTTQTTAQSLPGPLPFPGAAQPSPSILSIQSESTVTGRRISDLQLCALNPDDSSDDGAVPMEREAPRTATQLLPKPPSPLPAMQRRLTVTGRRIRNLGRRVRNFGMSVFNQDNSSNDNSTPIQRKVVPNVAQFFPEPFILSEPFIPSRDLPGRGVAPPLTSFPPTRSESTVARHTIRKLRLSVFNPDSSSDDEVAPIQRKTPQTTAPVLPKPSATPSNNISHVSFAKDRRNYRDLYSWGLNVAAEAGYPASSSFDRSQPDARKDMYGDYLQNTARTRPAVNPSQGSTSTRVDRREAVDKLLITVTADAESHVIVDVTGVKDAAFIRERMLSKVMLRIPRDDHRNYKIYRTELGEAELGDPVTDDQLMIYCGAWGDAKGTLKFLAQR